MTATTTTTPSSLTSKPQRRIFALRPLFSSFVAGKAAAVGIPKAGSNENNNESLSSSPLPPSPSLPFSSSTSWISRVQTVSNWASFLCVLDCTILPLLTVVLPLVGWIPGGGDAGSALSHTLCVWSHALALGLVMPVGTFTTLWNYATGHRNVRVASLGLGGVVLIGLANGAGTATLLHSLESILVSPGTVRATVTTILAALHHGPWHRVVNLMGCMFLSGSHYLSQQLGCDCGLPFCRPSNIQRLLQIPVTSSNIINGDKKRVKNQTRTQASAVASSSVMMMQTRMTQFKYYQQQQRQQQKSNLTILHNVNADLNEIKGEADGITTRNQ